MLPGSSIGQRLVLTSFGESHGRSIGTVLDGCPAGLEIDEKEIQEMLDLRKPGQNIISTQRKEGDIVEIVSGVFRGFTTGAPITMLIWNADQKSEDYENLKTKLRPGHSDYPAMMKYNQFNDHRGGGRFSGRLTATHVMGGAIARKLLNKTLGIKINSFTTQIGKIKMEKEFSEKMSKLIYKNEVRCPEEKTAEKMRKTILDAKKKGDSLGGIIESISTNVPVGLGEPIFSSLESDLSKAIFSIPS
ncbi:MAG TPA: chorismate synthase, partial [Nitrosopumilus sp.]|nr:chorismate synthase [Nitrosopumilus sp.]